MSAKSSNLNHVAVLGAGESGIAAAHLLAEEGARVVVLDAAPAEKLTERAIQLSKAGIELHPLSNGESARLIALKTDLCVLSPGIDPRTPLVKEFIEAGVPVTGELELASARCDLPIVAITGTNGKTTTTQLVEAMFNGAKVPTVACGNISPAFSSCVPRCKDLTVVTLEVSSFQLETVSKFRPRIAVWLNFAADHLDRYTSMEEYHAAKLRIFENQTGEDFAIINKRDKLPALAAQTLTFSAYMEGADFDLYNEVIRFRGAPILAIRDTQLRGLHNAENLMAAMAVGHAWGLDWGAICGPLAAYRALPHRCEIVREVDGVEYVNDSKATNLDAVEKALESETRPVVLIAGGKDKGFEFSSLKRLVAAKCRSVVLIGEMATRIEGQWGDQVRCQRAATLSEAVSFAHSAARAGDVVLLSPGTSSFDMFKSYADRGNQFRAAVHNLSAHSPS